MTKKQRQREEMAKMLESIAKGKSQGAMQLRAINRRVEMRKKKGGEPK